MNTPSAHIDFLTGARELSTLTGGTALGASATFTGKSWDCGLFMADYSNAGVSLPPTAGKHAPAYFRAFAASDVAGTLNIQQSPDGENWFKTDTVAIVAGFSAGVYLESKVLMHYVRAQLVNGSTAQTEVEVDTVLVSI